MNHAQDVKMGTGQGQAAEGRSISFDVRGNPKPQGSQQHRFVASLGRTIAHEKPTLLKWREQVATAAMVAVARSGWPTPRNHVPIALEVTFWRVRPKKTKCRAYPTTAPDVDKLLRGICDGKNILDAPGSTCDDGGDGNDDELRSRGHIGGGTR